MHIQKMIANIKFKTEVMLAGKEVTIQRIEITKAKVQGQSLENSRKYFNSGRGIEITVYDQRSNKNEIIVFTSMKKFEGQYKRALRKLQDTPDESCEYLSNSYAKSYRCEMIDENTLLNESDIYDYENDEPSIDDQLLARKMLLELYE